MTTGAWSWIIRHAKSKARQWSCIWAKKSGYGSFENSTPLLKVLMVLTRIACCPFLASGRTLKVPKSSEHQGLSNACELLLPLLMLSSDGSTKRWLFVAICAVPVAEEWKLERLYAKRMLEIFGLSALQACPNCRSDFSLGLLTETFNSKVLSIRQWER